MALNITLTAVSSVLSVFSMPITVNYALDAFMGGQIGLQFGKMLEVFAIILAPVVIGMLLMSVAPAMYSLVMYVTAAGFGWWVNHRIAPSSPWPPPLDEDAAAPRCSQP